MLVRNAEGDYSPAYRSLLEFFVAYKFAAELGILAEDFTELARQQSFCNFKAKPQDYTWSSYFQRQRDGNGKLKLISPLNDFSRGEISHLLSSFGSIPLPATITNLLTYMTNPKKAKQQLSSILSETQNMPRTELGYIVDNVKVLLKKVFE